MPAKPRAKSSQQIRKNKILSGKLLRKSGSPLSFASFVAASGLALSSENSNAMSRIFLLSPANAAGRRASYVVRDTAEFELARRLREEGVQLGEIFSFISGLYFRGKLAYAKAFARPPADVPGVLVITACGGLLEPHTIMTREKLLSISSGPVHHNEARFREPLERDAQSLAAKLPEDCEIILLGSVATPKYIEPLIGIWGDRLMFPAEFAGRGDMSRGGLMLRCVQDGLQLKYVPVATAALHGPKPAKLPKMR